jgi:hypothetical protein
MLPEVMMEFFATLECTAPYGYDMEKDYRECFLLQFSFFYFPLLPSKAPSMKNREP